MLARLRAILFKGHRVADALARSLLPVAGGIILGLGAAFPLTRFVESILFGISRHDPWTLASAALVFSLVAGTAAALPALRASRIDPSVTLRCE